MPFAAEFRAAMGFPYPGDVLGGFEIEQVEVQHHGAGDGRYEYPVRMVLRGPGGKQGVRRALKDLFGAKRTTFSGYGNPYHCWLGRPDVESLGNQLYEVRARGIGTRVYLREELERFCQHLEMQGPTAPDGASPTAFIGGYLEEYFAEVSRTCAAYRRRMGGDAGDNW